MKKITLLMFATMFALTARATEEPALSTTVTVGYDSRYVLYGYRLSRHLYKGDVYLYYPVSDKVSVWGGAWYGYLTDGTYNELDVYGGVDYAISENVSAGLAYSLFNYFEVPYETRDNVSEFAAHVTAYAGPLTLQVREHYDTYADGSLVRGIATLTQPVGDELTLKLEAEGGYAFEYFIEGNRWNHAQVKLSAPYMATAEITVTPFIARSIPLAAIDDFEQYETYGGLSVSYSF
jgi:hypothetical protein